MAGDVGAMSFAGSIWLMIAIILGLVATVITYMNSRKLKGDVFEKPFIYLALGILFATISLIAVTFLQNWFSEVVIHYIHDFSSIIGLGLILFASMQITKFLQGLSGFTEKLPKK